MQEMAFQCFKFQKCSGGECLRTPSGKPPPEVTNQARSVRDVNFPVRLSHLQGGVQVFHGVVYEGVLLPTLLCSLQRHYPNITII
jgi:hypothetical protein